MTKGRRYSPRLRDRSRDEAPAGRDYLAELIEGKASPELGLIRGTEPTGRNGRLVITFTCGVILTDDAVRAMDNLASAIPGCTEVKRHIDSRSKQVRRTQVDLFLASAVPHNNWVKLGLRFRDEVISYVWRQSEIARQREAVEARKQAAKERAVSPVLSPFLQTED